MPQASSTQDTLKRLIESEEQARAILKAAEVGASETLAEAREQSQQAVQAVRTEAADLLRAKLSEAESKGAAGMKQRIERADAEAQELKRQAQENLSHAVDIVVDWVTSGEDA